MKTEEAIKLCVKANPGVPMGELSEYFSPDQISNAVCVVEQRCYIHGTQEYREAVARVQATRPIRPYDLYQQILAKTVGMSPTRRDEFLRKLSAVIGEMS